MSDKLYRRERNPDAGFGTSVFKYVEVTIDYEAAIRAWFLAMDEQLPDREIVDNVLHAAIGDTK